MKLIILGIQGSGKGTQSKLIAEKYNLQHLSTGDMIRQEIQKDTHLGKEFKSYSESGKLVPNELVNAIIKSNLPKDNYLLDGFPRSLEQAKFLDSFNSPDKVIYLELSEKEVMNRLSNRFSCKNCKIEYGLNNMPKVPGICNSCKKPLEKRQDDNPDAITKRIAEFNKETKPLLNFYKNKVLSINANQTVENVFEDIVTSVTVK